MQLENINDENKEKKTLQTPKENLSNVESVSEDYEAKHFVSPSLSRKPSASKLEEYEAGGGFGMFTDTKNLLSRRGQRIHNESRVSNIYNLSFFNPNIIEPRKLMPSQESFSQSRDKIALTEEFCESPIIYLDQRKQSSRNATSRLNSPARFLDQGRHNLRKLTPRISRKSSDLEEKDI